MNKWNTVTRVPIKFRAEVEYYDHRPARESCLFKLDVAEESCRTLLGGRTPVADLVSDNKFDEDILGDGDLIWFFSAKEGTGHLSAHEA